MTVCMTFDMKAADVILIELRSHNRTSISRANLLSSDVKGNHKWLATNHDDLF